MPLLDGSDYAMITIYGDDPNQTISKAISSALSDKDTRLLTPKNTETLQQAAQNSAIIFISISSINDPNLALSGVLRENRLIAGDIIAFCYDTADISHMHILGKGFDGCIRKSDVSDPAFSRFLTQKTIVGNRRLSSLILEEEYRRVCDTLSQAPASMIIFDHDKRVVFVSDHYFRAYPRIAAKLSRGVSVYDAFELMAQEEGLAKDDPLYEKLQKFWYTLEGSFEFTLQRGISYRLKAVKLPNKRGILIMAQNISGYRTRNIELENRLLQLEKELKALKNPTDQ